VASTPRGERVGAFDVRGRCSDERASVPFVEAALAAEPAMISIEVVVLRSYRDGRER